MNALERADLMSLETYSSERGAFRTRVIAHKKNRQVGVGPNATLYFEDRLTIQYQVQEMLRIERIFEAKAIEEELEAYNPLIPNGNNLKATFMLEYGDIDERRQALEQLLGIEDQVWVKVAGFEAVRAIADEDLDRSRDEKTSAVHFMRFEFTDDMTQAAKNGAQMSIGIDHDAYRHEVSPLPAATRDALSADFS